VPKPVTHANAVRFPAAQFIDDVARAIHISKPISHNIKMFDYLAAKAIDNAIEVQAKAEGVGERL